MLVFLPRMLAQVDDAHWVDRVIHSLTRLAPPDSFFASDQGVRTLIALVLVSISCGAVGALVVGGRMAFFSDALAHCAFAGVSIGFLIFQGLLADKRPAGEFWSWVTPVMIGFGLLVGFGIALVKQRTGLASDTVIGIFFAAAIGLAAMLRKLIQDRRLFSIEDFLFGDPVLVRPEDLLSLVLLTVITAAVLYWIYNPLMLSSVNNSLALSRRIDTRLMNLLFILLLAVIVNLCLRFVGALLINALLVVPAATAVNLTRNLRQLFWWTIGLCVGISLAGLFISWEVEAQTRAKLGIPGTIILVGVVLFTLSTFVVGIRRGWPRSQKAAS